MTALSDCLLQSLEPGSHGRLIGVELEAPREALASLVGVAELQVAVGERVQDGARRGADPERVVEVADGGGESPVW